MLIWDQANLPDCVRSSSLSDKRPLGETIQLQRLVLTLMDKSPPNSLTLTPAQPEKWSSSIIDFLNTFPLQNPSELLQVT